MKCAASLCALLVACAASAALGQQFQCPGEGFFVEPRDCSKFVRCVDTFNSGAYQVFRFDCPGGELPHPPLAESHAQHPN